MTSPTASSKSYFTPAQRVIVSNQVQAVKLFSQAAKVGYPCPIPERWLPLLTPPALDSPSQEVEDIKDEARAHRDAWTLKVKQAIAKQRAQKGLPPHGSSAGSKPPRQAASQQMSSPIEQGNRDPSPSAVTAPPQPAAPRRDVALIPRPGPIYNIATPATRGPSAAPVGGQGYLQSHSLEVDVAKLIQEEHARTVNRALLSKVQELKAVIVDPVADPGMKYRGPRPPLGTAMLQMNMLKVREKQRHIRLQVEVEGQELTLMQEKAYRALLKGHRSQRIETARRDIAVKTELAAQRAREIKSYRSEVMGELASGLKDLRVARSRGVLKLHERLARSRAKMGDEQSLRMAALKAHDFEAYQEMLRQKAGTTSASGERYEAISKFLADTEAYLNRLASKIANVKVTAEASSAATRAMAEARARGLSEEEVQAAAAAAASEAAMGNEALRAAAEGATDAQSRYYALAHSTTEDIADQPRLLRPPNNARLREYQMVGLQWMVSLYNNHLNGILADEMGLGKTVQVMALIAYLMERKANYGPHLIIVPNAVMVNWKSELTQWLPSARCVYYVGSREERTRKYALEVQPLQFNVLVTTYEFIMRDRAKLSKIDWSYIIIDEAQRMKDRQSKLASDLDRFTATRRLLLSGTPLQNDLLELWSLLNLLLPDVFDDKKIFSEWFGNSNSGGGAGSEDDWLEKEKRVVVIHRLHQILEPFMLRRQVEDVESKLPQKTTHTVRVAMSAHQSVVYTWVKTTGTLRLDPAAPLIGKIRREFASLQNKCMELRKLCNHPMLSYPPPHWAVGDHIVRQCGKLVVLDRMLVKLRATGHRVLLFSTMTKLLDLLEVYLQWRELPAAAGGGRMRYLRIDGSTSLDDRETAIREFNAPGSDAFIFLLSIRAAGRGLNLQSADTVVIYDPDPNPKNEEQAIARSHRIGQTKEVRVFHLEAVTDAAQPAKPDGAPAAGEGPSEPPKRMYGDSIESVMRNQIQAMKIEMANEVIDAGRFDQQTSMEERRKTLETLLQDQDNARRAANELPTNAELNVMLARSPEEAVYFEKLDADPGAWFQPTRGQEVPPWMQWREADLRTALETNARHKVDIEAEMAALTGIVMHHHHAPEAKKPAEPVAGRPPRPPVSAAPYAAVPAVSAMTTTTMRSGMEEDEDEVGMADNDEEEEVLEQNIVTDDATTEGGPSASVGGLQHVQSTAAMVAPFDGAGAPSPLGKRPSGADDGEAALKKRRMLSVHFQDEEDGPRPTQSDDSGDLTP